MSARYKRCGCYEDSAGKHFCAMHEQTCKIHGHIYEARTSTAGTQEVCITCHHIRGAPSNAE